MVKELGAKFGLQGVEVAIQQMGRLKGGFRELSQAVDRHVPAASRKMDMMAHSAHKMANSVRSAMNMAKLAVAGFLTGKAIGGIGDWVAGDAPADMAKDYLRRYGAGPDELKHYGETLRGLKGRIPGLDSGDYYKGMFDVQSMFDAKDKERNAAAMETVIYLAKSMGTDTTIAQASSLMRKFSSTFGLGLSSDDKLKLMDQVLAQIPEVLKRTEARGHEIEAAIGHVGALYKQIGRSTADMLADIGVLAGALGERTGELLRGVMSKQGEGFGKMVAQIEKEKWLQAHGYQYEEQLPEKLKHWLQKSEKKTAAAAARDGAKLLKQDQEQYFRVMKEYLNEIKALEARGVDGAKILSDAYGETAAQGLPILVDAHTSGKWKEVRDAAEQAKAAEQKRLADESFQSFAAKYQLFKQKTSELNRAVRSGFQALVADQFEAYGGGIQAVTSAWDRSMPQIVEKGRIALDAFKSAFSAAFGKDINISQSLFDLAEALEKGDPKKWREIGEHLGNIAGTSMRDLADGLKDAKEVLSAIIPGFRELRDLVKGYMDYVENAAEIMSRLRERIGAEKPMSGPYSQGYMFDESYIREPEPGRTSPNSSVQPQQVAPPQGGGLLDSIKGFLGIGQITVEPPKVSLNAQIGDQPIRDIVLDVMESEASRHRLAAGDAGFARPWMG